MAKGIPFTTASDAHSHVQLGENYERLAEKMQAVRIREVCVLRTGIERIARRSELCHPEPAKTARDLAQGLNRRASRVINSESK